MKKKLYNILRIFSVFIMLFSSTAVGAIDTQFYSTNNILYFNPDSGCSTGDEPISGSAKVPPYTNPVYSEQAPDPSVIQGDDGTYYSYATGGTLLESKNLVDWKKISANWRMSGAPNDAGGDKWAPDVVKVGEKYILTYTIPTGTPENPGGGSPKIGYAVGDNAGGPFTFKGKLSLPYAYSIDSHIFVDDDDKIWMFWGGGAINVIQLTFSGENLQTSGPSNQLLTKGGVGSSETIEGAFVVKRDGWYYLMYSQGRYNPAQSGSPYRVLVARSKKVNSGYAPNNSQKPILEGKSPIVYPGHNSVTTDSSGNDWMVYHGYAKGSKSTRSMNIDKITYDTGWPVVNEGKGPSSSKQPGTDGTTATPSASTTGADPCCKTGAASSSTVLEGNDNKSKIWNYLVGQMGFTDIQAAGVMGNIQQESGFDPKALNPSSGAYGIIQWLGTRKTALNSFAASKGLQASDIGLQLDFMKKELESNYKDKVLTPLKAASTVKDAADIWLRHFEIPCFTESCFVDELNETRLPNSENIFKEYTGSAAPPSQGSTSASAGGSCPADNSSGSENSVDGMVIYNQEDPRWAQEVYGTDGAGGNATIRSSGCGPSAMASIITALSGKKVTPSETTAYAKSQGMYVSGVGSSHAISPVLAANWGLKAKKITNDAEVINKELRNGGMVITSGTGAAPFTSAGHIIAIRGVTDSGKWKIADSNGNVGQENSKKEWNPDSILGTANAGNFWVIYK